MEWDYSGRKGRGGQKKKIGKANERKGKVKRGKDKEVNEQGGKRGALAHTGASLYKMQCIVQHNIRLFDHFNSYSVILLFVSTILPYLGYYGIVLVIVVLVNVEY